MGTLCRSSAKRRAVTTTSCRVPVSAAAAGDSAGWLSLAAASGAAAAMPGEHQCIHDQRGADAANHGWSPQIYYNMFWSFIVPSIKRPLKCISTNVENQVMAEPQRPWPDAASWAGRLAACAGEPTAG